MAPVIVDILILFITGELSDTWVMMDSLSVRYLFWHWKFGAIPLHAVCYGRCSTNCQFCTDDNHVSHKT